MLLLVTGCLLVAGCAGRAGDGGAVRSADTPATVVRTPPPPVNLVPDGYHGRYQVRATVLEKEGHGPQLCMAVAESYPPQCGGPKVAGWKWSAIRHESAAETQWGAYVLVGTFDGTTFTLTEPAKLDDGTVQVMPPSTVDFTTPCPAPAGGWKPVDRAKATDDAFQQANAQASQDPDFGGLWIDEPQAAADPTPHNDPSRFVMNVTFVKDLARHEAELRKVWGGALCVSQARHTEAELRTVQEELTREPGVTSSSTDVTSGSVILGVFVALEGRQRELDAKYGVGTVRLEGAMKPLDR